MPIKVHAESESALTPIKELLSKGRGVTQSRTFNLGWLCLMGAHCV